MYLVLLLFGGVLTAAGIILAASGVSIHEHSFDPTVVTPGVVAAVGGLLLIGLGFALRTLQRIERVLASRPASTAVRPDEPAKPSTTAERPSEPARIPLPPKTAPSPQLASVAAPSPPAASGREDLPEEIEAAAALETAEVVEEAGSSPASARAFATSVEAASAEVERTRAARRRNGAAPARITPRLDIGTRSPVASERPKGPAFESLWPKKGPWPTRAAQPTSSPAPTVPVAEPEQNYQPVAEAQQTTASMVMPEPVSVLKSGVVDGMAYTLYSDGSIEAQLPQGTLRFGSITELRNHIEQSA